MLLGRIIGSIWATQKDPKLEGLRFQVVEKIDLKLNPIGGFIVAVDSVQAGVGEIVLMAQGSSARQTALTDNKPVDTVIMAIVENLDVLDEKELEKMYEPRRKIVASQLNKLSEV